MAFALGLENKRQVIVASVLVGVAVILAVWQGYRMFGGSSGTPRDAGPAPAAPQLRAAPQANGAAPTPTAGAGNEARRLTNADIEDLYGRVTVGTKVLVLPGKQDTTASVR